MGVEHQMAFTLPASPERVLAVALSRGARDYSDAERDFANRARPFLIQAYLNAIAYTSLRAGDPRDPRTDAVAGQAREVNLLDALRAAGLTRREAEVLRLVALGRSNHHIAAELGISYRTVGKHLEHSFRKFGVCDRSTAAARAWTLAAGSSATPSAAFAARAARQASHAPSSVAMRESARRVIDEERGLAGSLSLEHASLVGEQA